MTDCNSREERAKVKAYVCFRATDACADQLAEIAYREDRSLSYVARRLVEEGLERRAREERDRQG